MFVVADLHGLVNLGERNTDPVEYRQSAINAAAWAIACGVDSETVQIAVQSRIPFHLELAFYLSALAKQSELELLPQWKEFSEGRSSAEPTIAAYYDPVLMAADVLLYQCDGALVRRDQVENIVLAGRWAAKFNARFGTLFTSPEAITVGVGWYPRDLQHPGRKMSSQFDAAGTIFLEDSNDDIRSKVATAITDREGQVYTSRQKPGITNLINLAAELQNVLPDVVQDQCGHMKYDEFKAYIADLIVSIIEPIRLRYEGLTTHSADLESVLNRSTDTLYAQARTTVEVVRTAIGIG